MKLGHSSKFNLQTKADRFVHASRDVGSRGTPPTVASAPPSRHHLDMRRDPTHQGTSDLFSSAPVDDTSRATPNRMSSTDRPWHVLPKDLPNAVKHLHDEELDRLLAVTFAEVKRRGRRTSPTQVRPPNPNANVETSLTRGQLNAVRAAFKAGITPARIARQFGLSQSDVRKALATGASKGGSIG